MANLRGQGGTRPRAAEMRPSACLSITCLDATGSPMRHWFSPLPLNAALVALLSEAGLEPWPTLQDSTPEAACLLLYDRPDRLIPAAAAAEAPLTLQQIAEAYSQLLICAEDTGQPLLAGWRLEQHSGSRLDFDVVLRSRFSASHSHHDRWADRGGEGFAPIPGAVEPSPAEGEGNHQPELSEDLARILEKAFDRQVQQARSRLNTQQWGNVPGALRIMLESCTAEATAQLDWKRTLRIFASSGYRTRIVATNRKRSKQ